MNGLPLHSRIYHAIRNRLVSVRQRMEKRRYQRAHGNEMVLIYTMGKVGTTTLSSFFQKYHPTIPVHHVHFLSDYWVKEKLPKLSAFFHGNIAVANEVYRSIQEQPNRRLKIITFVREPLMREISDIFQNWQGLFGVQSIAELKPELLNEYLDSHQHEYALNWFDNEFAAWTGFDIYSEPFNRQKGYSIYKTPKADILCMKTERINDQLPRALMEFMDVELKSVGVANYSDAKEGKELYAELKNNYNATPEKLKLLYKSKLMTHFYTAEELDGFVQKWSRNQVHYRQIAEL